jgi:hypothetical protein
MLGDCDAPQMTGMRLFDRHTPDITRDKRNRPKNAGPFCQSTKHTQPVMRNQQQPPEPAAGGTTVTINLS